MTEGRLEVNRAIEGKPMEGNNEGVTIRFRA